MAICLFVAGAHLFYSFQDNDGFITKDEFQRISKKLNKEQIEAVFAKFDKDGDGVLSFEEFKKMLHKNWTEEGGPA